MKLSEYLSQKGLSNAAFAREIGVSAEAVGHYASGRRIPIREVMERIFIKTNQQVAANDFYATLPENPAVLASNA